MSEPSKQQTKSTPFYRFITETLSSGWRLPENTVSQVLIKVHFLCRYHLQRSSQRNKSLKNVSAKVTTFSEFLRKHIKEYLGLKQFLLWGSLPSYAFKNVLVEKMELMKRLLFDITSSCLAKLLRNKNGIIYVDTEKLSINEP